MLAPSESKSSVPAQISPKGKPALTNQVFISLGSNIEREVNLPASVRLLAQRCHLLAASTVYETLPVGMEEQANFFNAAVLVETPLGPSEFKREVLLPIERELGRVRTENKNMPRTIDLDLALFNDEILEYDGHHIPDPDLLRFAHVTVPIADIAPGLSHPETGERLQDIALRLLEAATSANDGERPLWRRPDIVLTASIED